MSADVKDSFKKSRGRRNRSKRKEEKEEEARVGPRDTKVVLVNQRFFDSLQDKNDRRTTPKAEGPEYKPSDFPTLSVSLVADRPPLPPLTSKWAFRRDPFPRLQAGPASSKTQSEKCETNEKSPSSDEKPVVPSVQKEDIVRVEITPVSFTSTETQRNEAVPVPTSSKKKKSKGPIVIEVTSALKAKLQVKARKPSTLLTKHRKPPTERLTGNILDASNPVRSKGKFREVKKKRLSSLKTDIIKDRIIKSLSSTSNGAAGSSVDLKREIQIYLENLKKERDALKEAHAQKPAVKSERVVQILKEPCIATKNNFSRQFRWYCENMLTTELDAAVKTLMQGVVQLQDKAFARDPQRARMRKRHVTGLREADKYLRLKKIKVLIIPPDLEAPDPEGAVGKAVINLKQEASDLSVPCIFALNRHKLGYFSLKKVPVSAFAVLSYDGLEEHFKTLMKCFEHASSLFKERFRQVEETFKEEDVTCSLLKRLNLPDDAEEGDNPFLKSICRQIDQFNPLENSVNDENSL